MSDKKALELLIDWFAYKPFKIGDMHEEWMDELAEVLGTGGKNSLGKRTNIGKRLTLIDGKEFDLSTDKRVRLVVLVRGVGDNMGRYKVEQIA